MERRELPLLNDINILSYFLKKNNKNLGGLKMRKTSDAQLRAVKKYTEKLYTNFTIALPKDLLYQFRDKCQKLNVSQRSTVIAMMQDFLKNN